MFNEEKTNILKAPKKCSVKYPYTLRQKSTNWLFNLCKFLTLQGRRFWLMNAEVYLHLEESQMIPSGKSSRL